MFTDRQRQIAIAALAALTLLGCGNTSGPLAPYEPQINNVTDNFQFQASNVSDVTWTYTYQWLNTGDSATVNQATTVSGGSATLTISDSTGAQLYSQSLSANGTFGMVKGAQAPPRRTRASPMRASSRIGFRRPSTPSATMTMTDTTTTTSTPRRRGNR